MTSPKRTRAILDAMAAAMNRKGIGGRGKKIDDTDDTVLVPIRMPRALRDRIARIEDNVSAYVRSAIERALLEDEST